MTEEQLSLKDSVAALRKSAHAAALWAHSFRDRQLTRSNDDISEASLDLIALGSLNKVSKMSLSRTIKERNKGTNTLSTLLIP